MITDKKIVLQLRKLVYEIERRGYPRPAVVENSKMKPEPIRPFILAALHATKTEGSDD